MIINNISFDTLHFTMANYVIQVTLVGLVDGGIVKPERPESFPYYMMNFIKSRTGIPAAYLFFEGSLFMVNDITVDFNFSYPDSTMVLASEVAIESYADGRDITYIGDEERTV